MEPGSTCGHDARVLHDPEQARVLRAIVDRLDEAALVRRINEVLAGTPAFARFSFDGDGAAFQLTCEAKRIDLAFLFDPMMAVHTSNVEPLPCAIWCATFR